MDDTIARYDPLEAVTRIAEATGEDERTVAQILEGAAVAVGRSFVPQLLTLTERSQTPVVFTYFVGTAYPSRLVSHPLAPPAPGRTPGIPLDHRLPGGRERC